jgi:hypothetical protein
MPHCQSEGRDGTGGEGVKEPKANLRQQQLRDLAACLRSNAAEIECLTHGEGHAEYRILGLRNHLNYVLQVLSKRRG